MTRLDLEVDVTGDPGDVGVLVDALGPEHAEDFPGVRTELIRTGQSTARILLESDRAPDLRAAVNAHLRWIRTVEDTLDLEIRPTDPEVQ